MYVHLRAHGGEKRGSDPPAQLMQSPTVVSHPVGVLGMEFRSSGRASNALMFEPPLQPPLLYILNIYK